MAERKRKKELFQSPKGRLQTKQEERRLAVEYERFNPQRGGYKQFLKRQVFHRNRRFNPQRGGYKLSRQCEFIDFKQVSIPKGEATNL